MIPRVCFGRCRGCLHCLGASSNARIFAPQPPDPSQLERPPAVEPRGPRARTPQVELPHQHEEARVQRLPQACAGGRAGSPTQRLVWGHVCVPTPVLHLHWGRFESLPKLRLGLFPQFSRHSTADRISPGYRRVQGMNMIQDLQISWISRRGWEPGVHRRAGGEPRRVRNAQRL